MMNPIIYIDELDKVSKTEQGREIIGILTHLIDTTQNDEFQDRYFSGIPFDLSKALFIFSYNDPDQIDRILLDRIHRIRFDNLSWSDKIVIVNKFIMPELNQKMGFDNTIKLTDEVIKHIIETYNTDQKYTLLIHTYKEYSNCSFPGHSISTYPGHSIRKLVSVSRHILFVEIFLLASVS